MKRFFVFILFVLSIAYLVNPGAGIFELIPDNIPLVGNLDEVGAAVLFLNCLRFLFGIDLTKIFEKEEEEVKRVKEVRESSEEKD
jgi:hypothetical protein